MCYIINYKLAKERPASDNVFMLSKRQPAQTGIGLPLPHMSRTFLASTI